jgi:hypothetical protein
MASRVILKMMTAGKPFLAELLIQFYTKIKKMCFMPGMETGFSRM